MVCGRELRVIINSLKRCEAWERGGLASLEKNMACRTSGRHRRLSAKHSATVKSLVIKVEMLNQLYEFS